MHAANARYVATRSLLARAALYRHTHDFARAHADLQEVFEIAEPSGMRLHLTDYHLEMAWVLLAEAGFDYAQPADSGTTPLPERSRRQLAAGTPISTTLSQRTMARPVA
ncbi:MAG: hypothetical protein R3E89_08505 [Thiolinea sp.]